MDFSQAELGPKMQLCSPRERAFVWHYLKLGGGYGVGAEAARLAGYSDVKDAAKVQAHQILQRERVLDALDEVGRKAFKSLMVPAVSAAIRLVENEKHPKHAMAVLSVLSRLGIVEKTGVDVSVSGEVTVSHTDEALQQLKALLMLGVRREKLEELFGHSGLSRYEGLLAEREGRASRETLQLEAKEVKGDGGG